MVLKTVYIITNKTSNRYLKLYRTDEKIFLHSQN